MLNIASHTRTLLSGKLVAAILGCVDHQIAEGSSAKQHIGAVARARILTAIVVGSRASIGTKVTLMNSQNTIRQEYTLTKGGKYSKAFTKNGV